VDIVGTNARIGRIAQLAHEANRAYCQLIGDDSQLPYNDAPEWQITSAEQGVQAIIDGVVKKPRDSHENWMKVKEADGWKYGQVKDPDKKEHPCMVPYDELNLAQQVKDHIFFCVVKACLAVEKQ
jgi:hypothetical protein